jgi:hypothetical protein
MSERSESNSRGHSLSLHPTGMPATISPLQGFTIDGMYLTQGVALG